MIKYWNGQPWEVLESPSPEVFKEGLGGTERSARGHGVGTAPRLDSMTSEVSLT